MIGAGERGLEIQGKFVKFTAIGVYVEDSAVSSLAGKWKGKSAEELSESVAFFRDIVTGNRFFFFLGRFFALNLVVQFFSVRLKRTQICILLKFNGFYQLS